MFIVAMTRRGPDLDAQLPELAKRLGVFPYDLRMRLAGPLPVVVARVPDGEAASALMHTLRGWGHGAIGCNTDKVPATAAMHQPREFAFEGELLRTAGVGHERAQVRADEVYALIHAMVVGEQQTTRERKSKKFSPARAVMTGGMVMTRKTKTTTTVRETTAEGRVYLIRKSFADPMVFRQHHLRYHGLGEAMARSSHASFGVLTERLRQFCPHAIDDDQLVRSRRKDDIDGGVDLAVYMILVGHARGQIA